MASTLTGGELANPIPPPVERKMVLKILDMLKRRPLQRIFQEPPPHGTPYARFVGTQSNREHIQQIVEALHCVMQLSRFANLLHRPELRVALDTAFFASTFAWIEFLLPICRTAAEVDALPPDSDFLTVGFTQVVLEYLQLFTHILLRRLQGAHDVLLASGQRATAVYVRLWMHWPFTTTTDDGASTVGTAGAVLLLLPTLFIYMDDSAAARAALIAEILRSVRDRPTRFFRRYAQCMRAVVEYPELGGDDIEMFVRTLLRGLIEFIDVPGLNGRLPTSLALTMMGVVDHFLMTQPAGGAWQAAWDVCATVCLRRTTTLVRAMEKGLFALTVRIRMTMAHALHLDRMIRKIQTTASMPRAIRAFHATLPLIPPSATYEFAEELTVNVFERRYTKLQADDTAWELVQTCCNAACPSGGGDADALRACACGEALYCSKTCQRAHWTEGGHRAACASGMHSGTNDIRSGTDGIRSDRLTAKQIMRYVRETRAFVEKHYADYRPSIALHIVIRDGEKGRFLVSAERSECPEAIPAPIVAELRYDRAGEPRTLRMKFLPECYAGRIHPPYRLLTQAFFAADVVDAPPMLPDLDQRERLFGRSGELAVA